jgi:hypothetical protein
MMFVAVAGDATFHRITQERTTVERCLEALKNIGSFMPNFSYFKMNQLEMGDSTVVHTVDRLCRAHHMCYIFLTCICLLYHHIILLYRIICHVQPMPH